MVRINRQLGVAGLVAVLCVALPSLASAQNRGGFWGGFGGGWGSAVVTCDDCGDSDREGSGTGYLKAGWTLNDRVLIGGEFDMWAKKDETDPDFDATIRIYNVSATVSFYPYATKGLFVKGGGGIALLDTEIRGQGTTTTVDVGKGPGFIVGAGYDIPIWKRVAVTPAFNYWYGRLGTLKVAGETFATGSAHNVVDITIGLTFP